MKEFVEFIGLYILYGVFVYIIRNIINFESLSLQKRVVKYVATIIGISLISGLLLLLFNLNDAGRYFIVGLLGMVVSTVYILLCLKYIHPFFERKIENSKGKIVPLIMSLCDGLLTYVVLFIIATKISEF